MSFQRVFGLHCHSSVCRGVPPQPSFGAMTGCHLAAVKSGEMAKKQQKTKAKNLAETKSMIIVVG